MDIGKIVPAAKDERQVGKNLLRSVRIRGNDQQVVRESGLCIGAMLSCADFS